MKAGSGASRGRVQTRFCGSQGYWRFPPICFREIRSVRTRLADEKKTPICHVWRDKAVSFLQHDIVQTGQTFHDTLNRDGEKHTSSLIAFWFCILLLIENRIASGGQKRTTAQRVLEKARFYAAFMEG